MEHLLRKIWTVILMVAAFQLHAQTSNLVVFNELKEDFTLVINGQRINDLPAQHVRVTGLKPSQYKVEATFVNGTLPKQVISLSIQANREISFALMRIGIAGPLEFAFLSEYSLGYFPVAPQGSVNIAYTGPLTDPSIAIVQPGPAVVQPVPMETVIVKPNVLPGYNGPIGCPNPMEQSQFEEAKKSIESKSFSDTKMQLAKQITRGNCLLTSQVREFMSLFSFESQKLDFAKFAYDYTYDKGNYYKVNDEFGFESSVRELEQHLRGK